jgi:Na+/melibiose symporter-like transporter
LFVFILSNFITPEKEVKKIEKESFFENIRLSLTLKSYSIFMGVHFCLNLSSMINVFYFPLYLKYVTKLTTSIFMFGYEINIITQQSLILLSFYILSIFATPIWSGISNRLGKVETLQITCLIYTVLLSVSFFIPSGFYPILISTMVMGLFSSGFLLFPDAILSDIIDEDNYINKKGRRDGLFIGVRGIFLQIGNAVQGIICGFLLSNAGYVSGSEIQSDYVVFSINVGYNLIPGIFFIFMLFLLFIFPLKGDYLKKIKNDQNNKK